MIKSGVVMTACVAALLLAGCGSDREAESESAAGEGRDETRLIRNTENIGYSGNAIGGKVDDALDANEARTDQLDQQLGEE